MRKLILLFAVLIIVVNIIILIVPQSNKHVIKDDVTVYLNKAICTEIYKTEEYQLLLDLQPSSYTVSDQIRKLLFSKVTFEVLDTSDDNCIVAISSIDTGDLYHEVLEEFVLDGNLSFSENKLALLELFYDRLSNANLKHQTVNVELEIIKVDDRYEVVLNRDFLNAIYGNIVEAVEIEAMEIVDEGDIID